MTKRPTLEPRIIEPNAVYTRSEVAALLGIHERTLQRFDDFPWSDLGEHTPRVLGASVLSWLKSRERAAA